LLVGRNNAGKSNLVDSLSFLHGVTILEGNDALNRRGGFKEVVFKRDVSRLITLALEFEVDRADWEPLPAVLGLQSVSHILSGLLDTTWEHVLRYRVRIGLRSLDELLEIRWNGVHHPLVQGAYVSGQYTMQIADIASSFNALVGGSPFATRLTPTSSSAGSNIATPGFRMLGLPNPHIEYMVALLKHTLNDLIFRVSPIRNPQAEVSISSQNPLQDDGGNLASWLHYLRSNDREAFAHVVQEFRKLVPEAKDLTTPLKAGPQTTVSVEESWFPGLGGFGLPSASFGERNLLVIVSHLVAGQPSVLLAIEEPENDIHPAAQHELATTLWRFGERRQILATTHSVALLSSFPIESWKVVSRSNGTSSLSSVDSTNVGLVVSELGMRPSDLLDNDAIAFVEGPTDEAAFSSWLATLRRTTGSDSLARIRCLFVSVKGLTNMPFYLDARIVQSRAVKPLVFYIIDGDVHSKDETADQWRMVEKELGLTASESFRLEAGYVIEDYLLSPDVMVRACGNQVVPIAELRKLREEKPGHGDDAKAVFNAAFERAGTSPNAGIVGQVAASMSPDEIPRRIQAILERIATRVIE